MTRRTQLLQAGIQLATRSDKTKWEARLYSDERGERLLKRAWLQSKGAMRLMKWAGV